MTNKEILVNFIKNENKFSFGQSPTKWLNNNNLQEFLYLIDPTCNKKTKQNILEFCYGLPHCKYCKIQHNRILGNGYKGWSLTCSEKCRQNMASDRQLGINNTSHKMSIEEKKQAHAKQSKTMKSLILNGKFTPKTENYHLFGTIDFLLNGEKKSVRSLWEMIYWLKNPLLEYEKIRLEYYDTVTNKTRIYIPDFYDKETNTITEIKPKKYQYTLIDKQKCVLDNGFVYKIVDDTYFNDVKTEKMIKEIQECSLNFEKIKNRLKWLKKK